ncbi:MAG: hypothetical protein H7A45_08235 [Verrucomicrobiales bacterium]|nr:hypothetical protein [Verrucomicrobiales bacterium]
MKKLFVVLIILLALLATGLGVVWASLNRLVRAGVMRGGAAATQVDVFLDHADISLLSGRGTLVHLVVGNPEGYLSPEAIRAEVISIEVDPLSLLRDKIHIKSIRVVSPEITFDGVPGENNLSRILAQVRSQVAPPEQAPRDEAPPAAPGRRGRRLQVDDFSIIGARLNLRTPVTGNQPVTLDVDDIRLARLGQDAAGVTAVDLVQQTLSAIVGDSTNMVGNMFQRIGEEALEQAAQGPGPESGAEADSDPVTARGLREGWRAPR